MRAKDGQLTIDAGNLAGSDLDMISAVRNAHAHLNVSLADALLMASRSPALALGLETSLGAIAHGQRANLVHVSGEGSLLQTWIDGVAYPSSAAGLG